MTTADTILNINFPSGKADRLKGVRFTQLGTQTYSDEYIEHINDADERHYTLIGDMIKTPENARNCDVELHENMYVTITPMHVQMTNFDALKKIEERENEIEL
jgi:5'-nucleotidase